MSRPLKTFLCVLFAAAGIGAAGAQSTPTIYVAGFGGAFEKFMKTSVIPSFEAANKAKVEYVVGSTAATLAKLQAQRNAQEIDVALLDVSTMSQAVNFGFCTSITPDPIYKNLSPITDVGMPGKAIGFAVTGTGILYNADQFKKLGLPAPTSWLDLGNPAYKGQVGLAGVQTLTGLQGLAMVNRALGSSESDMDRGFVFFKDKVRPNVVTFAPSPPKLEELMQTGEINVTVLTQLRALSLQKQGLPIVSVVPKEGASANIETVCPIVNSDQPDLSQKFIRHLFSDEVQKAFASLAYTPVRTDLKLPPDVEKMLLVPIDKVNTLVRLDEPTVVKNRPAWIQRWNREVER